MKLYEARFETRAGDIMQFPIRAEDLPTAAQIAVKQIPADQTDWEMVKVDKMWDIDLPKAV